MKNYVPAIGIGLPMLQKIIRIMKLFIICFLCLIFQVHSKEVNGQNVNLQMKQAEIRKVLTAVEKQTNIRFVYNYDLKSLKNKVDFVAVNLSLPQALERLFRNSDLTYKRVNDDLFAVMSQDVKENPAIRITGKITGENKEPLFGVSVVEKGKNTGTVTDDNGMFSLNAEPDGVLLISFIGFENKEVPVSNQTVLNVQLKAAVAKMDEVVVVGYGQQKKSLVTGAISSIKSDQLATVSNTRIEQAIQGRVSGVQIVPTSGQPGAGLNIRIRGTGSNRSSNPLFIIDGVRAGGIESIDPNEIAGIEILKDAASAAIYGAEGANGVIIVTTKTGKRNTAEISYQGQFGQQSLDPEFIKMMSPQQYQQYLQEAGVAGRPSAADAAAVGEGTKWMDEVLQTAPQQHHTLTFSGGSDKSTYLVSGNLFTQDGIVGGDKSRFNRYTVRFNSDHRLKSWLNFGNRLVYSHHRRKAISDNDEFGSILSSALVMDPITPTIYPAGSTLPAHVQNAIAANKPLRVDPNGNIYGISNYLKGEYGNPLARIDMAKGENIQNKIVGNVFMDIEPFAGFKFTSRFGIDAAFQVGHNWTPTFWFSDESQNTVANGSDYSNNWFTWQLENFATYQKRFGSNNLTFLAGISAQKTTEQHMGGSYSGLFKEEDRFSYADFVPDAQDRIGSIAFSRTLASFYGRINYDFDNRYLFSATIRRDGSSLFAPDNKWATFPSLSAGWVFTNENFFPKGVTGILNYGKLRASWGQNGSLSNVALGEWMNTISAGLLYPDASGALLVGAAPTSFPNPELQWETSEQFDIGADFAFFGNKLNLTVDYYKKTTKDLLTAGNAPLYVGNILRTANAGDVVNKGLEIELSYRNQPKTNGFSYDVSVNFTTLDNEVTYLDPNSPILYGASVGTGWSATAMQVGYPIWYFNGYKTNGIFQNNNEIASYIAKNGLTGYSPKPGEPVVVDVNGDKQISPADMTFIGSPHPDYMYGGRVSLGYKGFDFMAFIQGQIGNERIMGFNRADRSTANKPAFFYNDRWTGEGSTNTWFAPNTSNPYIYNSDLMVFDGSYARIRQLQLGYTLPASVLNKMKFKNLRVYVSLDDFFTITNYPGVDPEGGSNNSNSLGIDRGGYPLPRKVVAGLSFTF